MSSVDTPTPEPPPSIRFIDLLLRPKLSMERCRTASHVPLTALWSVIAAAGIVFYPLLRIYPRDGFGLSDALATLGLVSPVLGLLGLRIAGWVLSKSGKFLGGIASATHCHGALSIGLLPLGCTLIIALPLLVFTPAQEMVPSPEAISTSAMVIALLQMVGTLASAVNVVQAVSGILAVTRMHAIVSLMGMFGFIYAAVYLLRALN